MSDHVNKTLEDHEGRLRFLERSVATETKVGELEERVRKLEVSTAKMWMLMAGASAIGSGTVAFVQNFVGK